ncbi:MAG: NAD(P)H-dependent oxidoreductase [Nostoc sp. DedVER02]|uniref:glutathione-regulated potassium-efflux system oxidoreductase KefF n=1 Tax=unclassified Nostoc TaxID=2593658 RepID=UPI002AD40715|nr:MULTISPECIES: NAD(P)H-dependent oxidoreductase [unclassified Nostoc]MDZ7988938.1 NAD(P)H-dependent oxidoreductase [Nostoc sp. DedVER02]MDZ8114732.1 NAD(P)H-dependent oxidoreductase [Nostoc sp. DedVER01b]
MGSSNQILILFAHPALEKSRVNRHLIQAVQGLDSITIHDLYEAYPNFDINVKFEQDLLLAHDIIVFQHPFYWYSSPAILKEWLDLVLEHGFAYGNTGTALHGKKLLSAITTGGSEQAYCREGYNYFSIQELLVPFEQTARLCGMEYLPPFLVHETHQLRQQHQIAKHADDYRTAIIGLRDNTISWELLKQFKHLNQNLAEVIKIQEAPYHAQ